MFSTTASRPCSDPGVYGATAIVDEEVGRLPSGRVRLPVAGRVAAPGSARIPWLQRFRAAVLPWPNSSNRGQRGIDVLFVEDFATVDQVTEDREEDDDSPFRVEATLRRPARCMANDGSVIGQSMQSLDAVAVLRQIFPSRVEVCDQFTGRK